MNLVEGGSEKPARVDFRPFSGMSIFWIRHIVLSLLAKKACCKLVFSRSYTSFCKQSREVFDEVWVETVVLSYQYKHLLIRYLVPFFSVFMFLN